MKFIDTLFLLAGFIFFTTDWQNSGQSDLKNENPECEEEKREDWVYMKNNYEEDLEEIIQNYKCFFHRYNHQKNNNSHIE